MMKKTKLTGLYLLITVLVISFQFCNSLPAANVETVYGSIGINLTSLLGKDKLLALNTKLYQAAVNGQIKAYRNDSMVSFYTKNEVSERGTFQSVVEIPDPADPKKESYTDSVIVVPFQAKDIVSNSISFKLLYDEENNFRLEFNGFSLKFNLISAGINLGQQDLLFISANDLNHLLGQSESQALFLNCYKAMLKSIDPDSASVAENKTSFQTDMSDFWAKQIRTSMNLKMYAAVLLGISEPLKPFPAYKTDQLKTTYTGEEVINREDDIMNPHHNDDSGNDSTILIHCRFSGPWNSETYSVSYHWNYDEQKLTASPEIWAYGIYLVLKYGDSTPHETYFWLAWKDAIAIYPAIEISTLKYAFYKSFAEMTKDGRLYRDELNLTRW